MQVERKEGWAGVSPSQSNKVSLFGKNKTKKTQRGMRQNRVTVSSVAQHTHNNTGTTTRLEMMCTRTRAHKHTHARYLSL